LLAAAAVLLALAPASGQARADDSVDPSARAAAAAAYLNAVCPANAARVPYRAAVDRAEKAGLKTGRPIPGYLRTAMRNMSAAMAREGRLLYDYPWPEELSITYDVRSIAEAEYENSAEFSSLAKAKKWRDPDWAYWNGNWAASARLALGLPPAGENDGCP